MISRRHCCWSLSVQIYKKHRFVVSLWREIYIYVYSCIDGTILNEYTNTSKGGWSCKKYLLSWKYALETNLVCVPLTISDFMNQCIKVVVEIKAFCIIMYNYFGSICDPTPDWQWIKSICVKVTINTLKTSPLHPKLISFGHSLGELFFPHELLSL